MMQCVLGLLVFKTGAGLSVVTWAATAAADLLLQGQDGGARFFWRFVFSSFLVLSLTPTSEISLTTDVRKRPPIALRRPLTSHVLCRLLREHSVVHHLLRRGEC
jgi:hypothetical protein